VPNTDSGAPHVPRDASCARKPGDADSPGQLVAPALYPVANGLGVAFHPTFQGLRRSFSTHGKKEAHPTKMQAQLGHSDIRTTLEIYTQIGDPEVARMVNDVTNRIPGLGQTGVG
jgi:integrase